VNFYRELFPFIVVIGRVPPASFCWRQRDPRERWTPKPGRRSRSTTSFAYAPGGTSDVVARAITPGLSTILGVRVVVDNKPGGNGVIAPISSPRRPDGYTLLHTSVSFFTVTPQCRRSPTTGRRTSSRWR
jgi:hypothetical protein